MDIFPLKNRVYLRLYGQIVSGKYANDGLPPEQEFARQLDVSRNTLREALAMLENDGLLQRCRTGTQPVPELPEHYKENFLFCKPLIESAPHVGNSIYQGFSAAAKSFGRRALFVSVKNLLKIPPDELRTLLKESCCMGLVMQLRNFCGGEKITELVRSLELPAILAYCEQGDREITGFAAIRHCGRESWSAALRHLVDSGHRRIVTLTLEKEVIRECFSPEEYAALLTGMGLDTAENPVLMCKMNDHEIKAQLEPLFKKETVPDAILCYSDYWALPVYRVLKKLKLRIPEDISVMGYCGSVNADFISPKLTTVAIGYEEIGWMAVRMLSDSGSWYKTSRVPEFVTPYMLKVRESTRLRLCDSGK